MSPTGTKSAQISLGMEQQNPRVLFLNRSYWPDVEATGQLLTELCESLSDEFRIEVLAGKPNQIKDLSADNWTAVTDRNGVRIHRVNHWTLPKRAMFLKGLNYLSFIRATQRALRQIAPPEVVVFETDPFLLPFCARSLQRRSGCRMIGYLQDIYPDVAVAMRKVSNNWSIRRLRRALFSVYRTCDQMVVLSQDMKQLLVDSGISESTVVVVPNWADPNQIQPLDGISEFRKNLQLENRFVVMYSGNLGLTQRLEEFIDAAELLRHEESIAFVFVGEGSQKSRLQSLVNEKRLTNVRFCGYQPRESLTDSLGAADIHLIPLTRELSRCLMPSKLYGILSAGRPYLTNAVPESELFRLTTEFETGFAVEPGSTQAIARAILTAKNNPEQLRQFGRNGRQLALARYTREASVSRFRSLLHNVLNKSAGQRVSV